MRGYRQVKVKSNQLDFWAIIPTKKSNKRSGINVWVDKSKIAWKAEVCFISSNPTQTKVTELLVSLANLAIGEIGWAMSQWVIFVFVFFAQCSFFLEKIWSFIFQITKKMALIGTKQMHWFYYCHGVNLHSIFYIDTGNWRLKTAHIKLNWNR